MNAGGGHLVGSRMLLWSIRQYQSLRAGSLPHCRYEPTCSHYAAEAIEVHGARRGLSLALRRIGRCHPWGGHGFDPVPLATKPGGSAR